MVKINYILFYALRKLFDDLNSDLGLFLGIICNLAEDIEKYKKKQWQIENILARAGARTLDR